MMIMMMTLLSGFCPGACSDMDGGELAARVCLGQWHLHASHIRGPDLHGQQVTILRTHDEERLTIMTFQASI